jgi:hypothetical protein
MDTTVSGWTPDEHGGILVVVYEGGPRRLRVVGRRDSGVAARCVGERADWKFADFTLRTGGGTIRVASLDSGPGHWWGLAKRAMGSGPRV